MKVKELKKKLNELPEEFDELDVLISDENGMSLPAFDVISYKSDIGRRFVDITARAVSTTPLNQHGKPFKPE